MRVPLPPQWPHRPEPWQKGQVLISLTSLVPIWEILGEQGEGCQRAAPLPAAVSCRREDPLLRPSRGRYTFALGGITEIGLSGVNNTPANSFFSAS